LQVQIFLSDISNFAAMNEVWDAWVPQGHTPPRATIESRLARPEYLVEIKVIAAA
jgi:enamine deaminase RidA (YjgF/YER057c/UK114 family)